jgi:hypothetical protein
MTTPKAAAPLALEGAPLAAWQSQCRGGFLVWAAYRRTDY